MNEQTKVLIVEDELPLAAYMVNILTRAGCDADIARTGKQAIEKASETRFDLITLDIGLSDTSGFEICSELKQRHISCKTPIIFISASFEPKDIAEAKKRGATDYLAKPFDPSELIYKVVYHSRAKGESPMENSGELQ